MSDTTQTEPEGPFAATPRKELERQVMDPNVPKMEREWWAADEITRLRNELHLAQEWSARVIDGQEQDMTEITALRAKVEKLEGALRNAYEVYAGSDGFIPETAAEGYQQQIIKQMAECISAALGGTP